MIQKIILGIVTQILPALFQTRKLINQAIIINAATKIFCAKNVDQKEAVKLAASIIKEVEALGD